MLLGVCIEMLLVYDMVFLVCGWNVEELVDIIEVWCKGFIVLGFFILIWV